MADLIDTIDGAAARLLEMAGFGATVASAPLTEASLTERVKAFEAAVEWAKTRNDLRPPDKGKSKFDGIREQFSQTDKRRRRPAAPENSPTEPAAPEPVSADLFES